LVLIDLVEGGENEIFRTGIAISIIALIISLLVRNPESIVNVLLIIGIIPMVFAALFSGVLVSGDRIRGNYSGEDDFRQRMSISTKLFLLGLPCLLTSFAIYFITK
jgi:hypothetical protein